MRKSIEFVGLLMALMAMCLAFTGCNNGSSGSDEPALPEGALTGAFSVADGVQVHFSKGNLYYSGSTWKFEANQYSSAATWDTSHVSHFFWSKKAGVAYAGSYSDSGEATSDVLFTNATETTPKADFTVNGVTGKYRALSRDEWQYLFNYGGYTNTTRAGLYAYGVTVAGKTNCVVLYPDGWTGAKVGNGDTTSYDTAEEWAIAEAAGAVCLPAAGYRCGSGVRRVGDYGGFYWSASASGADFAYYMYFYDSIVYPAYYCDRYSGQSVRLV